MENQQQNSNSFWNNIIEEYLNGESMNKLSIKYNINLGTLRYHLIKNSVKVRSVKESFMEKPEIKLSKEFRSLIIGLILGDGSSTRQSKAKTHRGQISCKHYNEFILSQLKQFGDCKYYKYSNGGAYYLNNKSFIEFLRYIGECPIECYKYKWITRCSETIMEGS